MEVYTRVFALDMAATAVPFTGDGRDAAEILRSLPRPAEIGTLGMTSCIPLIRNTGAERIQPLPAPAHQSIMLMTEPPWSYPVTCNPAGINIPQTRQGTMQAFWPCIPRCVIS